MVAALTALAPHAAPVFGSVVSVRHVHWKPVVSVNVDEATVVPPLLIWTAAVRDPASLFCIYARAVTAIVLVGVEAMVPMV
jgi:hypothetical protein